MDIKDSEHAQANARGWLGTIREQVAALEPVECETCGQWHAEDPCAEIDDDLKGDSEDALRESVRERIQESPLSVLTRSGWREPGSEPEAEEEYEILLSTGGPALRLRGELSEHGEPASVRMEWQDWGTSWTEHRLTVDEEADVLTWCSAFYFGEGEVRA